MAYDNTDLQVRVDGTVGGTEAWSNTWTLRSSVELPIVSDAITAMHDFYDEIATALWTATTSAVSCSFRYLDGAAHGDAVWATITGANAGPALPSECAVRVSLSDDQGHRGGPFLTGFRSGSLTTAGLFTSPTTIVTAVENLQDALVLANWKIGIDLPTTVTAVDATQVRVGEVYDVIRRRRNDLPENYVAAGL